MRYYHHYGHFHELRMWLQLFTHWAFLVSIGVVVWLVWLWTSKKKS